MKIRRVFALFTLLVVGAIPGLAHDPGVSSARIIARDGTVEVRLGFGERDAVLLLEALGTPAAEPEAVNRALTAHANRLARIMQGTAAAPVLRSEPDSRETGPGAYLIITYALPSGAGPAWEYHADALALLPEGHRQLAGFGEGDAPAGEESLLDAKQAVLARPAAPATAAADEPPPVRSGSSSRFATFFALGVEHIVTGYDHLLFLLALVVVCAGWRDLLLIVSSFTVAHSVTLALAAFGVINFPGEVVEPLIAASIVVVGVENLVRRRPSPYRPWLTFAFGLVHGFGFAGLLGEALGDVRGAGIVWPLLGFNLGIETGQIALAAITLPGLAWLRARPRGGRVVVPAISVLVTLAGGYWLVTRLAGS